MACHCLTPVVGSLLNQTCDEAGRHVSSLKAPLNARLSSNGHLSSALPLHPLSLPLRSLSRQSGNAPSFDVRCAFSPPTVAAAASGPPPVAITKSAFLKAYPKPIPSIYSTVIQELLVLQHLDRYNTRYKYDPVFALGFVTIYDQLMDGFPAPDQRDAIFKAYVESLGEKPAQYRADAQRMEKWAEGLEGGGALVDFAVRDGDIEKELKEVASRAGASAFHYTRFFAVGLFRLLELTKSSDPEVLEQLCDALGVNKMSVNRDLDTYRGLLSRLTQAKELFRDFLNRERVKREEREKEKLEQKETAEAKSE